MLLFLLRRFSMRGPSCCRYPWPVILTPGAALRDDLDVILPQTLPPLNRRCILNVLNKMNVLRLDANCICYCASRQTPSNRQAAKEAADEAAHAKGDEFLVRFIRVPLVTVMLH